MNQRFQNEEIKHISEQYAENELYKAVSSIGTQLENELTEFGLCSEECFTEVVELLSEIAEKGEDIVPELDNLWLRKENEFRRFDRHVNEDEIRKAVGIVFGFAILAVDSSHQWFYRYTLSEQLNLVVASHQLDGWRSTLDRIFSVPLPDGWFDAFIKEEPEESEDIKLPKELDTPKARKYFAKAIELKYMEAAENGKYRWIGTGNRGVTSQLAYFLGRVYNYKHTISGNVGEDFPEDSLNQLFGVKRLYSLLTQVYNAMKTQRWRSQIDSLFE
jgi:hypothetical protein